MILINRFNVTDVNTDDFISLWEQISKYMEKQPGFVNTKFSRSLNDSNSFVNIATWQEMHHFQDAINTDEFRQLAEPVRSIAVSKPELYQVLYES